MKPIIAVAYAHVIWDKGTMDAIRRHANRDMRNHNAALPGIAMSATVVWNTHSDHSVMLSKVSIVTGDNIISARTPNIIQGTISLEYALGSVSRSGWALIYMPALKKNHGMYMNNTMSMISAVSFSQGML